jgi:hypothetical protein
MAGFALCISWVLMGADALAAESRREAIDRFIREESQQIQASSERSSQRLVQMFQTNPTSVDDFVTSMLKPDALVDYKKYILFSEAMQKFAATLEGTRFFTQLSLEKFSHIWRRVNILKTTEFSGTLMQPA